MSNNACVLQLESQDGVYLQRLEPKRIDLTDRIDEALRFESLQGAQDRLEYARSHFGISLAVFEDE